jgi:hypothetical protein
MRKDCSNMDGVIENFDAVLASSPIKNRFDQDNFYPMDGMVENYEAVLGDTPIGNRFDQDNFYPASGLGARLKRRVKRRVKNTRLAKKVRKFKAKKQEENVQNEKVQADARKQLAKGAEDDKVLLDALKPSATVEVEKKGMSMGAKIGIGVGIAAVLGIGAYFLLRKKK